MTHSGLKRPDILRRAFADDGAEVAEVAEVVADHYRQALDAASDDDEIAALRAEASAAYRRAGDRAAGLGASGVAAKAYLTAIELTDDPTTRTELRRQAGVAAGFAGQFDTAVPLLEQAVAELDVAGRHEEARMAIDELSYALRDAGRPTVRASRWPRLPKRSLCSLAVGDESP